LHNTETLTKTEKEWKLCKYLFKIPFHKHKLFNLALQCD
jgi:hypothetical protein